MQLYLSGYCHWPEIATNPHIRLNLGHGRLGWRRVHGRLFKMAGIIAGAKRICMEAIGGSEPLDERLRRR